MKNLILILMFGMLGSVQSVQAQSIDSELGAMEAYILDQGVSGYKLEEIFKNAQRVSIQTWPKEVRQSIYVRLWNNEAPFLEDPMDLSDFRRDFGINMNYSGSIIRSFQIKAGGEVAYLAIYLVYGGEYGNEQSFLEYYFLNESGTLLRSGRAG